jgi:hypothetical protein
MTSHRLARLKRLARGAALVSAGAAAPACGKDKPPNVNAPFEPTVHANATAQPPPSAPVDPPTSSVHVNAPFDAHSAPPRAPGAAGAPPKAR